MIPAALARPSPTRPSTAARGEPQIGLCHDGDDIVLQEQHLQRRDAKSGVP
jgi:hypothetical protein